MYLMFFMILFAPLKFHISYPKASFEEILKDWMRRSVTAGYKGNMRYKAYIKYVLCPIHTLKEDAPL